LLTFRLCAVIYKTNDMEYELDKDRLDWLTDKTNRSDKQTQFLYRLVDGDFDKLKSLELKIKNCFYFACPSTKKEANKVLDMQYNNEWFSF